MSDGVPKVRLGLSDLITRLYRASGLSSLAELARALQVDQSYVVRMLKPVDEGGRLPSVGLLTRLADVCGRNEAERRRYRTLLHQAKLSGRYPDLLPPVAREAVPPLSLPTRFCRRLAKDLSDGVPKVRLGLSDLITRLYRASGLSSLAELARALQVDQSYVVRMLKPVDEGGRLPSVGLLTRLADVCGRNEAERRRYRTLLHQAKLSGRYPDLLPPVAREAVPPLSLPTRFCRRLAKDLEAESLAQQRAVAKACKTSLRQIWNVTRGKALMSPWQVTRAAVTLAQEPGNYLRLAGYVPRGLQRVLEQDVGSLEDLSRLSPRAFNELAQKGLGMPRASVVASRTAKGAPRRRTS